MSAADLPSTMLRRSYEQSRDLDSEAQVRELIDHLENPEVLSAELLDAVRAVERCADPAGHDAVEAVEPGESHPTDELILEHFYPRREITVRAEEPYVFTCLASDVHPLAHRAASAEGGLDYVGLLFDRECIGVIGAVETPRESTPYLLLLRALCGLSEMLPAAQLARLNRRVFKGALGEQPIFDLQLVRWAAPGEALSAAHGEPFELMDTLTRDLADVVKSSLLGQTEFPGDLGSISCLRMDPDDFDGCLYLDWKV